MNAHDFKKVLINFAAIFRFAESFVGKTRLRREESIAVAVLENAFECRVGCGGLKK